MIKTHPKRMERIAFSPCATSAPAVAPEATSTWFALPPEVVGGGEIVLLAIRPSLWRPFFAAAPWLGGCFILGLVMGLLEVAGPGLSRIATLQLILLIAAGRLGLAFMQWTLTWYVLTNRRILDVQGVWSPRIWSCHLVEIRNTYLNASTVEKVPGLGTITFATEHADEPPRRWCCVVDAKEVHARIRRAIENAIDQHAIGA